MALENVFLFLVIVVVVSLMGYWVIREILVEFGERDWRIVLVQKGNQIKQGVEVKYVCDDFLATARDPNRCHICLQTKEAHHGKEKEKGQARNQVQDEDEVHADPPIPRLRS